MPVDDPDEIGILAGHIQQWFHLVISPVAVTGNGASQLQFGRGLFQSEGQMTILISVFCSFGKDRLPLCGAAIYIKVNHGSVYPPACQLSKITGVDDPITR